MREAAPMQRLLTATEPQSDTIQLTQADGQDALAVLILNARVVGKGGGCQSALAQAMP